MNSEKRSQSPFIYVRSSSFGLNAELRTSCDVQGRRQRRTEKTRLNLTTSKVNCLRPSTITRFRANSKMPVRYFSCQLARSQYTRCYLLIVCEKSSHRSKRQEEMMSDDIFNLSRTNPLEAQVSV